MRKLIILVLVSGLLAIIPAVAAKTGSASIVNVSPILGGDDSSCVGVSVDYTITGDGVDFATLYGLGWDQDEALYDQTKIMLPSAPGNYNVTLWFDTPAGGRLRAYLTGSSHDYSIRYQDEWNGYCEQNSGIDRDLATIHDTDSDLKGTNDPDGDGIVGDRDNCPYDFNPDQEDGWGSPMGDLCDTEWYNRTGQGVAGFVQKDGVFHLHGNCLSLADGAPRCPVIAAFDPATFDQAMMSREITSDNAGTWSVWLYFLHNHDGVDVYQVNVYSTQPPQPDTLVDDQLEIHVQQGDWQWFHRGGQADYHGI